MSTVVAGPCLDVAADLLCAFADDSDDDCGDAALMPAESDHVESDSLVALETGARGQRSAISNMLREVRPQNRSHSQQLALVMHMQNCKLRKQLDRERAKREEEVAQLVTQLDSSALRCNDLVCRQKVGMLMLDIVGKDARRRQFTPVAWLRMSFDFPHAADRTLAEIFHASPSSIKLAHKVSASVFQNMQLDMLRSMHVLAASEGGPRLTCAVMSISFDETIKTLAAPKAAMCDQWQRMEVPHLGFVVALAASFGGGASPAFGCAPAAGGVDQHFCPMLA